MYEIVKREQLAEGIVRLRIFAPLSAKRAQAGQFVILRAGEGGERIPLTISSSDAKGETVDVVIQTVGEATMTLAAMAVGERLATVCGPLGTPTDTAVGSAVVVGGGVGCAIALPVARQLKEGGAAVTSVIGFRSRAHVLLKEEFSCVSDRLFLVTDDGSDGERGNVCMPLSRLLEAGERPERVYAVGPLAMMKAVAETTRPYQIPTVASMNPIMIDGTGMCGCCRVRVGGEMKFACVDGPDFDAHLVDFDEAIARNRAYLEAERRARERACRLLSGEGS